MGQRERDRSKVVHEVEQEHLRQWEAAGQLGMSERGFRKLLTRVRQRGDGGGMHALRGRASRRRIPAARAMRVVKLVEREYAEFGPTLACEYLEREHGLKLSRESSSIRVEQQLDGAMMAWVGGARIALQVCQSLPAATPAKLPRPIRR